MAGQGDDVPRHGNSEQGGARSFRMPTPLQDPRIDNGRQMRSLIGGTQFESGIGSVQTGDTF